MKIKIHKESDRNFIASMDDQVAQGETVADAVANLKKQLNRFISDYVHNNNGKFPDFTLDHNVEIIWDPSIISQEEIWLD